MPRTAEEQAELDALEKQFEGVDIDAVLESATGAAKAQEIQTNNAMFGKPPSSHQWTPKGELEQIPGAKVSEAQARMRQLAPAAKLGLQQLEKFLGQKDSLNPKKSLFDPTLEGEHHLDHGLATVKSLPYIGGVAGTVLRPIMDANYRAYDDQVRALVQNILYAKSGAQATDEETAKALKGFMPAPGDDKETAANKWRSLQLAVRALEAGAEGRELSEEELDLSKAFKLSPVHHKYNKMGRGMSPEMADEAVDTYLEEARVEAFREDARARQAEARRQRY